MNLIRSQKGSKLMWLTILLKVALDLRQHKKVGLGESGLGSWKQTDLLMNLRFEM